MFFSRYCSLLALKEIYMLILVPTLCVGTLAQTWLIGSIG